MDDEVGPAEEVAPGQPELLGVQAHRLEDAVGERVVRRQRLRGAAPTCVVGDDAVRERAADVDSDAVAH